VGLISPSCFLRALATKCISHAWPDPAPERYKFREEGSKPDPPQHFTPCQGPNLGGFYSFPLTTSLCIPPFEIHVAAVSPSLGEHKAASLARTMRHAPSSSWPAPSPRAQILLICRRNPSCDTAQGQAPSQPLLPARLRGSARIPRVLYAEILQHLQITHLGPIHKPFLVSGCLRI